MKNNNLLIITTLKKEKIERQLLKVLYTKIITNVYIIVITINRNTK